MPSRLHLRRSRVDMQKHIPIGDDIARLLRQAIEKLYLPALNGDALYTSVDEGIQALEEIALRPLFHLLLFQVIRFFIFYAIVYIQVLY